VPIREFDLDFEGGSVHCYEGGSGTPILLLHGSGAGTSSSSNWALVLEDLASHYHVLAGDLIGFGLSSRKPVEPYFDLDLWLRQAQFLLDRVSGGRDVGYIGHSLSAFLGLRLGARNPHLVKMVLTGCPSSEGTLTRALEVAWSFPDTIEKIREMYGYVVADASALTDAFYAQRLSMLDKPGYRDYFSAMFSGDKRRYLDEFNISARELCAIRADVLFIHGLGDQLCPFRESILTYLSSIMSADALLLQHCGHGPALEQPRKFLHAVRGHFG
jgi:2-hydroxymuconate-semialdehyde hydrolase